jgi:hypothetical protein
MTTITAPAPLVRLDAPLPSPRQFTLLDAAQIINDAERWQAGARINAYPAGPASTFDPCSTGTGRAKAVDADNTTEEFSSFTVYLGATCTGRSIGSDSAWYRERLRLAFEAVEAAAVERVLVTGDGFDRYLGDDNMAVLGSGAVTPLEGLALLEEAIGAVGGGGIIHAAPAVVTYWESLTLLENVRGVKRTRAKGTPVAAGDGYIDALPDGESAPASDREWAFASGPVQIRRDQTPEIVPGDYSQSFDRSSNEVTLLAERNYLLTFVGRQSSGDTNHVQAGVLIDRIA